MGLLFCKIWASGYGDIQLFVPGKLALFVILGGDYVGYLKTVMVPRRLFSDFIVKLQCKNEHIFIKPCQTFKNNHLFLNFMANILQDFVFKSVT